MSKFLRNLLVQISKVCQKSKFQTKFEKILFLESGHFRFRPQPRPTSLPPPSGPDAAHLSPSPFRPSLPRGLPLTDRQAHPVSRPTVFFLRKPDQPPVPPPAHAVATLMTPPLPKMAPHFPPSSLPTHPSVCPPHRTGQPTLMPPPPAARFPSPSSRPASPPTL
jgi:hypothetical protein